MIPSCTCSSDEDISNIQTRDIATNTDIRKLPMSIIVFATGGNNIQPTKLKSLKCPTIGSEMLQFEADLKTRRQFDGDILETP